MRRYQLAKLVGGALILIIFAGWLVLQWSNLAMRVFAIVLMLVTLYVMCVSILGDRVRSRGRQIAIEHGTLRVTTPEATAAVLLSEIALAEWREEPVEQAGLHLLDPRGRGLAHIDTALLADEAEARAFLGWLRDRAGVTLKTRWPSAI
jgi:hypothetical protein